MEPLGKYFGEIDGDFIGMKKATDDVYVYNATDVLVQSTWELPIVIQWPESTVKFEFSCSPSDITFGVVFVAAPEEDQDLNELEIETIEEMGRVDSSQEPVTGSFEVPCEGVVFFLFDNNYDWTANKKISYLIEVMQPSFSYIDEVRTEKVLPLVMDVVEELDVAYTRQADAQDCIEHNTANVNFLEEQIHALQQKLDAKNEEQDLLEAEMVEAHAVLLHGYSVAPGLAIRMLNKHLLGVVLGHLDLQGGCNTVCKYWAEIMLANRKEIITGAELVHREAKMSQRDLHAALFEIRFNSHEKARILSGAGIVHRPPETASGKFITTSKVSVSPRHSNNNNNQSGSLVEVVSEDSGLDSDLDGVPLPVTVRSPPKRAAQSPIDGRGSVDPHISRSNSAGVHVSYDHLLPTGSPAGLKRHSEGFTAKLSHVLSPDEKEKMAGLRPSLSAIDKQQQQPRRVQNNNYNPPESNPTGQTAEQSHSSRLTSYIEANSTRRKEPDEQVVPEARKSRKTHLDPKHKTTLTSGSSRPKDSTGGANNDRNLLQHVKKIRSEQQLTAMLEYIQAGFNKIETLSIEKRRVKKLIRAWNSSFEKKNGRLPTSNERKGHLRELYEEYQQSSLALRIRTEKMEDILKGVGLDRESFEQLRDKHDIVW